MLHRRGIHPLLLAAAAATVPVAAAIVPVAAATVPVAAGAAGTRTTHHRSSLEGCSYLPHRRGIHILLLGLR